jgi:hypothetical protein
MILTVFGVKLPFTEAIWSMTSTFPAQTLPPTTTKHV